MRRTAAIVDLTCDWCRVTSQHAGRDYAEADAHARRRGWQTVTTDTVAGPQARHRCPRCVREGQ